MSVSRGFPLNENMLSSKINAKINHGDAGTDDRNFEVVKNQVTNMNSLPFR